MKRILYILFGGLLVLLPACNKNKSTNQANQSLAQLTAFYFAKNDTMPGLAKAVFTIEERIDTGLVWNKDSMLYGTNLHRVVPRFTFASTPDVAYLTMHDTIHVLSGYDTLDFTKTPIYLTIRSADKKNTKVYEIRATVHSEDPDLYTWEQLNSSIYGSDDSEQRVVEKGSDFLMLTSNGITMRAYRSADGTTWSSPGTMSGLPAGTKVRQIVSDGNKLYYGQDSIVYTSTDAVNWTGTKVDHRIEAMLMHWNGLVWALVTVGGKEYELAHTDGTSLTLSGLKPGSNFPVSDFATVCFLSSSLRERAMIIGGFAENGQALDTRWNIEYSKHITKDNGYRLQEFKGGRSSFNGMTGISVIYYNHQLLLFGGVDENSAYFGRDIMISVDEGLNWTKADTAKNQLPSVYQARQKQNAIVRNNNIYLFGGQDAQTTYSDVYKGRLNSIDW